MQVLKEEIRKKILETGKREFLEKGFQKTSMKKIAEGAGIKAPTIYCYFRNKENLFLQLVKAVTTYFEGRRDRMEKADTLELARSWGFEQRKEEYKQHMQFIGEHREEFQLLFSSAGGSSLENYFDRLVMEYEDIMKRILNILKQAKVMETPVTDFFVHNMAAFYVTTLREASIQEVSKEELDKFAEEWALFRSEGWKELTCKKENNKGRNSK